jgi:hypothetical protein
LLTFFVGFCLADTADTDVFLVTGALTCSFGGFVTSSAYYFGYENDVSEIFG